MFLAPIPQDAHKPDQVQDSEFVRDILNTYAGYYTKTGYHEPWIGYFIVQDGIAVGTCGFTGRPQNNRVEIAYYTFKPFEGRGIATFACKTLMKIALQHEPGLLITAKTAPEENASTAILKRSGFEKTGTVQDEGIGNAWEWVFSMLDGLS